MKKPTKWKSLKVIPIQLEGSQLRIIKKVYVAKDGSGETVTYKATADGDEYGSIEELLEGIDD